jgi:spore maturation protein CgeB
MFVTTGGKYRNAHAKYVEVLASRSLLLADEPIGAERLGLEDGINYVRISEADVLDKVAYYLAHPDEAERIAAAGYATAFRLHECRQRAGDFYEAMRTKFEQLMETCPHRPVGRQTVPWDGLLRDRDC